MLGAYRIEAFLQLVSVRRAIGARGGGQLVRYMGRGLGAEVV